MADFELCVIGSGPGGQKAAIQAAKLGHRVCVIERMEQVGGVAVHTGTIPSKALREAILRATSGKDHLNARGELRTGKLTIGELLSSCQRIIATEMEIVQTQLRRNGVVLIAGEASFTGPGSLVVRGAGSERTITADRFLIATGSEPARPDSVPFDDECVLTSDDLLRLTCLPETLIVCGGGVIGTEFASMFARLGVRVTLVERGARVLGFLDLQIGEALQYHLRSRGLTLRLGEEVTGVHHVAESESDTAGVEVSLRSGKVLRAQAVLWCLGRHGATSRLNLPAVGLDVDDRGRLAVDQHYRTANPAIYAVGDVIGFPALASTSMNQGRTAVCHMFGVEIQDRSRDFPIGIYSIPEISTVGRSEEQLTEEGVPYETGSARYTETARGQLLGDDVGMLKIIFHPQTHHLLGVHIIGTGATELIHIGQAVMSLGGTVDYFVESAFNYPTLAECYRVAALNGLNKLRLPYRIATRPAD
ncbi:MAG: Si-specific NAD(P)(+) transhydrogenase [bacterium]|nr:Si-specific NAD(P)(+) transhydrogenase [bacterium]